MSQGKHKVVANGDPFTDCLSSTLEWEGGWYNHPKDPGGRTMQGVILERYHEYRRYKKLPLRDVSLLERDELLEIYKHYYWDVMGCSALPPGPDLVVFDFGVNSGPGRGTRFLKKFAEDLDDHEMFVRMYMDEREKFLRSLRTFKVFGKGWINRTRDIRARAIERCRLPAPPVTEAPAKAKPGFWGSLLK